MEEPSQTSSPTVLSQDSINLRHYWHIILERRWLVMTAFFSVFVLSLLYLFKVPRVYQGVAVLQIDREEGTGLNEKEIYLSGMREQQDYLQTQYKNLKSRTLLESVYKQLGLSNRVDYAKEPDPVRRLSRQVQVVPIRLSRLVEIRANNTDARLASQIANTLVTTFTNQNLTLRRRKAQDSYTWLTNEIATLGGNISAIERDLHQLKETNQMTSLEGTNNIVAQALLTARFDLSRVEAEAEEAQRVANDIKHLRDSGTRLLDIAQIANDIMLKELSAQLAIKQAELDSLLTRYKNRWPKVQEVRKEIASLQKEIEQKSESVYAQIQNAAGTAKAKAKGLAELVEKRKVEYLALSKLRLEYDDRQRTHQTMDFLYKEVLRIGKETELASNTQINNMRVVDEARVPVEAISPKPLLVLPLGVIGGLIIAIGLAFFVNYMDDSIKSQDDVEAYLRLPFLGYIPNIKTNSLVERDLQSHLHPRSNAAEGFRTIRATISLMPKADRFHVVAVTSTVPSEGKSLCATNLAIVNAQTGLRTLLVDADLRRPSVHKSFGLHSPVGLSAYLQEEVKSIDEIIQATEVPNLEVACCGAIPNTPSELISSKRMLQFLQDARSRYDRVILDCPPVSAVSDPLVLAARADGILFVTKFNKIRREHARRTIQRIQDAGIHIIGGVLNDIDFEGKDSYYYSYYYYQNRYYASHYRSDGKKSVAKEAEKGSAKGTEKVVKS